jgi:two-component system CheB/CheR fusion protein
MIVTYNPDRDAAGNVRGVVLALSDISDRVAAEHALRDADRRKDEFLAMLAHELRNPLAPILNATHLLRLERANPSQIGRARDIIDRQVRHMARLVDDLLDVSRITLGRINLRPEEVTLETVIANAVEASRPLIDASRHELSIELPQECIHLTADATRLSQVFLNLLNNAAKYTPPGGKLRISARREGDEVAVSVRDTGVGIPPQMLPRIFDLFTQVDRSPERTQGGLGLGLTLASRLVTMHGGHIEARSEGLGKGSEFIVHLPAPRAPAEETQTTSPPTADAFEGRSKRRVLVVDDNVDAAASLNMLLQASGHETRMVHDGLDAVKAADEFRPDVVLLDIGLPRLNGYEAARRIREGQGDRHPIVVALTGWGQDEDKQRAREAGFDMHLTKPVDPMLVMQLVSDTMGLARRRPSPAVRQS